MNTDDCNYVAVGGASENFRLPKKGNTMKVASSLKMFLSVLMILAICDVALGQDHEAPLKAALRSMNWASELGDFDLKLVVRRSSKVQSGEASQSGRYVDGFQMFRAMTLSGRFVVAFSAGATSLVVNKGVEDLQETSRSHFVMGDDESATTTSLQVGTTANMNCPKNGRSCFQTSFDKWELSSLPLAIYFGEVNSLKWTEELVEKLTELKSNDVKVDLERDDSKQRVNVYRISIFYPRNDATNFEENTRCIRMTVPEGGEDEGLITEISQAWISGKNVKYVDDAQVNKLVTERIRVKWRKIDGRKVLQSVYAEKNPNHAGSSITNCTLEWKSFETDKIKLPDAKGCEAICLEQRKEIDKLLKR